MTIPCFLLYSSSALFLWYVYGLKKIYERDPFFTSAHPHLAHSAGSVACLIDDGLDLRDLHDVLKGLQSEVANADAPTWPDIVNNRSEPGS